MPGRSRVSSSAGCSRIQTPKEPESWSMLGLTRSISPRKRRPGSASAVAVISTERGDDDNFSKLGAEYSYGETESDTTVDNLKAYAVVSNKEVDMHNFHIEKLFYKKPMKIFVDYHKGLEWVRKKVILSNPE